MRKLDAAATILIILGAIAWGFVGLFTIKIRFGIDLSIS
jgi:uncharacterized membrane protein YuzA (DUF378 family)